MQGEISYRQIVLSEGGVEKLRLPLVTPLNDMLGWIGADETYAVHISPRYMGLGFPQGSTGESNRFAITFLAAAEAATKGKLSAAIAEHLEQLRFAADGTVDQIPNFAALAAWSLLEGLRRQPLKLYTCPNCKKKWLGSKEENSRYCQRLAPGQPSKDCRTLAYERRVAGDTAYRAYRREYKRISEMQRRGNIDLVEMFRWRDENDATSWVPFDEWKGQDG